METAPPGLDVNEVRTRILALPGVVSVHDLHIWTLTSGMENATGHVVVAEDTDSHDVLDRVVALLAEDYQVTHATIQCEPAHHEEHPTHI